jgi:sarcosine oxidase subunit alpha
MLGHVTSTAYSFELGHPIALALLRDGKERGGDELYAAYPLENESVKVRVVSPHFIDPDGERMRV